MLPQAFPAHRLQIRCRYLFFPARAVFLEQLSLQVQLKFLVVLKWLGHPLIAFLHFVPLLCFIFFFQHQFRLRFPF